MSRPNILVFLTDDHGQWASQPYGNSELVTPTLSRLAATGAVFENAFTPTPVCSPARATFWTGKMPSQHGIHDYIQESPAHKMDHPGITGQTNLAQRLQQSGYHTGLAGKWHAGGGGEPQRGFDYWYSSVIGTNARFGEQQFNRNHSREVFHGQQAPQVTRAALDFLDRHVEQRGADPFFLFVGHVDTHSPFADVPPRWVDHYRRATFRDLPEETMAPCHTWARGTAPDAETEREWRAQYYGAVSYIDEQIGQVLDHLQAAGKLAETLIVYTADHGHMCGHHGLWCKGNATIPPNMIEESIRIPCIVSWPEQLAAGQRCPEVVTHCDTFTALLDAADLEPPPGLPGRSWLPLLRGEDCDWPTTVFGEYGTSRMIRTERYKYLRRYPALNGDWPDELYDLVDDPRERSNLITDVALPPLLTRLRAELDAFFERYTEPQYDGRTVADQPRHNDAEVWRLPVPETAR